MADRIQLRRDAGFVWSAANPILGQGEPGVEIDTMRMKIGNGLTHWNDLPYVLDPDLVYGYVHTQSVASEDWVINHNMGKFPSVVCFDSANDEIEGQLSYVSLSQVTIHFSSATGGVAYLN
jgi:hypothetical protein